MEESKYYIGTDLKFKITITAEGFSQDSDDYKVELYCGNTQITINKEDIVKDPDTDDFYMMVETSKLRPGMLRMVVTAFVPDDLFPSGVRKEVTVQNIAYIKSVK